MDWPKFQEQNYWSKFQEKYDRVKFIKTKTIQNPMNKRTGTNKHSLKYHARRGVSFISLI